MTYITLKFYVMVAAILLAYYTLPLRTRWIVLLGGSIGFYGVVAPAALPMLIATIVVSYAGARVVDGLRGRGRIAKGILAICVALVLIPMLAVKNGNLVITGLLKKPAVLWIVPMGISFYTLQIIAYLVDVHKGRIAPERNLLKYALFVSFFPQIIQGPIPRYDQLQSQLTRGNRFDERGFTKGLQLILWGFFLKLMVADKASVIVNAIFDNSDIYKGMYVIVGGVLYSVQLYADFLACVTLSQGVAALFGVQLADNFKRPYGATSIKEFWRRWHISLSTWLRDYIYIPLGGNRKGTLAKYKNLIITFAFSGIWHGAGVQYLVWGLMHAGYQIVGEMTAGLRAKLYELVGMPEGDFTRRMIQTLATFAWVMLAWIVFRANTLAQGVDMIASVFRVHNPWILFDGSLFNLGLGWQEWAVLLLSVGILFGVSIWQKHGCIRDWILSQHALLRWSIYIAVICGIWILGTYGYGFNAQDFIYGGF